MAFGRAEERSKVVSAFIALRAIKAETTLDLTFLVVPALRQAQEPPVEGVAGPVDKTRYRLAPVIKNYLACQLVTANCSTTGQPPARPSRPARGSARYLWRRAC